ncbi:hypothetical protein COT62_01715, partial [Candidatus Roizmanbacteria bacterium CG09_land_8_20_14_0_10_41_9]
MPKAFYDSYRKKLINCLNALDQDAFARVVGLIEEAYQKNKMILVFGNGGSAATASHFECDLAKGPLGHRGDRPVKRFKIIALTDNIPVITAWANDADYENIFAEQLRNLGGEGDLAIGISASGNSPNILKAIGAAKELGMKTIGFCGFDGGKLAKMVDTPLVVRTDKG